MSSAAVLFCGLSPAKVKKELSVKSVIIDSDTNGFHKKMKQERKSAYQYVG